MITVEQLKSALPVRMGKSVNDALVARLNEMIADPDACDNFRDNFISYAHVAQSGKYSLEDYVNAVMYVSYKLMDLSNTEAFKRVFPKKMERYKREGKTDKDISSFITAYNKTKLVNQIFEQTMVPVHVYNQGLFQEALNRQAWLMRNAKREDVQQKAADSLISALQTPTTSKIQLDIGVKESSVISQLRQVADNMANTQREQIVSGQRTARDVAESKIIEGEAIEVIT